MTSDCRKHGELRPPNETNLGAVITFSQLSQQPTSAARHERDGLNLRPVFSRREYKSRNGQRHHQPDHFVRMLNNFTPTSTDIHLLHWSISSLLSKNDDACLQILIDISRCISLGFCVSSVTRLCNVIAFQDRIGPSALSGIAGCGKVKHILIPSILYDHTPTIRRLL